MKLFDVYPLYDIEPVQGKGAYIFDKENKQYLDFYGGHAVISIGHSHPHFVERITEQLKKLAFYSNSIQNPLQQSLADALGALSGLEDYQLFFTNSGAESNENALKLASFISNKTGIIAFKNGFHGRTSAAVNVTDNEAIKAPLNKTFETHLLALEDLQTLEQTLSGGNIAAVIIEGIQGIGGIYCPSKHFLEETARLCKKYNALLILDEVQSGYGRTGNFFAFQIANIAPDMVTMAKGMGNGFPIGGVLIHPDIQAKYGMLGTTFGGNHLACAAGLAVLEVIKSENLIEHAQSLGQYILEGLKKMPHKDVRGRGLMLGIELDYPIAALRKNLIFNEHIFTGSAKNPNTLRLLPPLNVGKAEADILLSALNKLINVPANI